MSRAPALHPSVIVYGPSGCGKTANSHLIAQALGLRLIKDGWDGSLANFDDFDTLYLTNAPPDQLPLSKALSYDRAMILVNRHRIRRRRRFKQTTTAPRA